MGSTIKKLSNFKLGYAPKQHLYGVMTLIAGKASIVDIFNSRKAAIKRLKDTNIGVVKLEYKNLTYSTACLIELGKSRKWATMILSSYILSPE